MLNICLKSSNKLMLLAICIYFSGCRHSYDDPKKADEIQADKNSAAQPIMQGSNDQNTSGMQPIAPLPTQTSRGMQPMAPQATGAGSTPSSNTNTPHTVVDSNRTETTSTTTVTNPDGSTTTTTTVNGLTTTTTTTTVVVPSDDPASIAVTRTATSEEARASNCFGAATVVEQGLDANRDGVLNPNEITQSSVSCQ